MGEILSNSSGALIYKINTKSIFAGDSYLCITELLNLSSFANAVKSTVLNFIDLSHDWLAYFAMIDDTCECLRLVAWSLAYLMLHIPMESLFAKFNAKVTRYMVWNAAEYYNIMLMYWVFH